MLAVFGHQRIWVCLPVDGQPAHPANGSMVGLHAESPALVDAFHAAALANGGTDEGAPAGYKPGYYFAYLRDPDGNKISAFCDTDPVG